MISLITKVTYPTSAIGDQTTCIRRKKKALALWRILPTPVYIYQIPSDRTATTDRGIAARPPPAPNPPVGFTTMPGPPPSGASPPAGLHVETEPCLCLASCLLCLASCWPLSCLLLASVLLLAVS